MASHLDIEFLRKVPLFHGLNSSQLESLCQIIKIETYHSDQEIIIDGDKGDSAFILLKGEVSISKKLTLLPNDFETESKNKVLIRLTSSSHALFGEMALFDSASERSATVTAVTECQLGVIHTESFLNLVQTDFGLGSVIFGNICQTLSERLKKANKDIIKLSTALSLALSE